jgi:hypothetical protein
VFSGEVLEAGTNLFQKFVKIQYLLKEIYNRVCEETFSGDVLDIREEISHCLQDFDNL